MLRYALKSLVKSLKIWVEFCLMPKTRGSNALGASFYYFLEVPVMWVVLGASA